MPQIDVTIYPASQDQSLLHPPHRHREERCSAPQSVLQTINPEGWADFHQNRDHRFQICVRTHSKSALYSVAYELPSDEPSTPSERPKIRMGVEGLKRLGLSETDVSAGLDATV